MMNEEADEALDLLAFWQRAGPERWFSTSPEHDAACGAYRGLWERARSGAFADWQRTAAGCLAYILLTDQIPRNIGRGEPSQFATDALALSASRHAVAHRFHRAFAMPLQNFFLMPFMHAEDLTVQEEGLDHYRALGDQTSYYHALVHHDAIRRFGRFPHRNAVLGRATTEAEAHYLRTGGFGG